MVTTNALVTRETTMAFISSMIGSSCCLIQLVYNLLSWPCAGFAVFDRYRPFFQTVLMLQTIYAMFKIPGPKRREFIIYGIAWLVFFSPNFVALDNQTGFFFGGNKNLNSNLSEIVTVKVAGLKCVSCANRFKNQFQTDTDSAFVSFENPKESFANISLSNFSIGKSEIELQKTMTDPAWSLNVVARKLTRNNNENCLNDEKLRDVNFKLENGQKKLVASELFDLNLKILESDKDFCSVRLSLNQTIFPTLSITQYPGKTEQQKRIEIDSHVFVHSN